MQSVTFRELQRPACIRVLLGSLGRFVGPDFAGALAFLDRFLLGLGIALLRGGNQRGIDDLPAHGEIAALFQFLVKGPKQRIEGARLGQLLAK